MNENLPENNSEGASFDELRFDDASFEDFFKKHFLSLCAFCQFKFGLDLDMAKEVVHMGFIKLWDARKNLAPGLSPKSYLYKIIINNVLDSLKHGKIRQQYVQFVLQSMPENMPTDSFNDLSVKQLQAEINAAIAELPGQMRRVFEMSRFEGLKYSEIAEQLNISVKTVETQMGRALAKLREKLSAYGSYLIIVLILSDLVEKYFF
ncbi:MAG: RNA polymerase sigma-70 factor [Niastella sp.]|jgi:RNA polymerase sigma-70 factor (ECF subfamily)|uniref:RNA polymerase sigma-70 factor n=1 Tax=Niastella sp. TaxID=1869183 RepID=UPI00389AA029